MSFARIDRETFRSECTKRIAMDGRRVSHEETESAAGGLLLQIKRRIDYGEIEIATGYDSASLMV